jgi:type I restriction enzyme R subunit
MDKLIRANRVVDWTSNLDVQNQMRNEIDDFLYEMKELNEIDLTLEDIDFITESTLTIAKARYP